MTIYVLFVVQCSNQVLDKKDMKTFKNAFPQVDRLNPIKNLNHVCHSFFMSWEKAVGLKLMNEKIMYTFLKYMPWDIMNTKKTRRTFFPVKVSYIFLFFWVFFFFRLSFQQILIRIKQNMSHYILFTEKLISVFLMKQNIT